MEHSREEIYLALYDLLCGLDDWKFTTRKFVPITQVSEGQFPALLVVRKNEQAETNGKGIPIRWILAVDVVVYVDTTEDPDRIPAELLNPILDKLEAALQPPNQQVQTLGGLVSQCRIRGLIETDEGMLGSRGFIAVPVEIIVPA